MNNSLRQTAFALACMGSFIASTPVFGLTRLPAKPLEERVASAESVFVGTLVNRVESGEWVEAELRVDKVFKGVEKGSLVPVIWRKEVGSRFIYDAAEKQRGIALLDDKHEGRYWLRNDKFEPISKQAAVSQILFGSDADSQVPSFEAWVKAGHPIPEGTVVVGGSPWFDESKGRKRSPEAVYKMLFGAQDVESKTQSTDSNKKYPEHWGEPPELQTRDLRALPGGYGMGSSTLAEWIETNLARDAAQQKSP